MARYNLISIAGLYLTTDATSTGDLCRTEVTGLDAASFNSQGQTILAIDGTAYNQIVITNKKGLPLRIEAEQMSKELFDDLIAAIDEAMTDETTVAVSITGDTGTFSFTCLPRLPDPVEFPGSFIEERIRSVAFNFVIQS